MRSMIASSLEKGMAVYEAIDFHCRGDVFGFGLQCVGESIGNILRQ